MKFRTTKTIIALVILLSMSANVFAKEIETVPSTYKVAELTKAKSDYSNVKGKVLKVVNQDKFKRIMVKTDEGETVAYNVYQYTPIYNYDRQVFQPSEGDNVMVAYKKNTPVTDSVPPQINASAVVILDNSYTTLIDSFDNEAVNSIKTHIITPNVNTKFYDSKGKEITENDIKNNNLIVLYSTEAIGNPKKILAKTVITLNEEPSINKQKVVNNYLDSLKDEQIFVKDNIKYIRLTDIANKHGYKIIWDNNAKKTIIKSGTDEYSFKTGENEFTKNKTTGLFTNPPVINNNKTYIEIDFASKFLFEHI